MKVHDVSVWYFSSRTPPWKQTSSFCEAHLIVSPHTSQLTNAIFAAPRISVIELQPLIPVLDTSFKNIIEHAGLHYQVIGNPIYPPATSNELHAKMLSNWRGQDIMVNLTALKSALKNAYTNLVNEGYTRKRLTT
jgi:hypothetical protein